MEKFLHLKAVSKRPSQCIDKDGTSKDDLAPIFKKQRISVVNNENASTSTATAKDRSTLTGRKKSTSTAGKKIPTVKRKSRKNETTSNNDNSDIDDPKIIETNQNQTNNKLGKLSQIPEQVKEESFNNKWLGEKDFKDWLMRHNDGINAYCKICEFKLVPHRSTLSSHIQSKRHLKKSLSEKGNSDVKQCIQSSQDTKIARAEIKLTALVGTNHLAFLFLDTLSPVCRDVFPDSKIAAGIHLKRTKGKEIMTRVLGPSFEEDLIKILQNCYFSLLFDETTDKSTKKQCACSVIYYGEKENEVVSRFFDIYEGDISGDCKTIFDQLKGNFDRKKIPMENIVGFSTDTTNVMAGANNSLYVLMKKEVPNLVYIKCTCHMIHLCSSYACMKLPRSLEDLIRDVSAHFHRSSQRQSSLETYQQYFGVEIHKILKQSGTRWLSLKSCVDRLIEQFEVLKEFFKAECLKDHSRTTNQIYETLNNNYTLAYLEFLSYVTRLTNDINVMFQSRTPLLYKLKNEIETLLKTVCMNFLDINYVRQCTDIFQINQFDQSKYVSLSTVYLGVSATEVVAQISKTSTPREELNLFYKTCLDFYVELVTQIKQRFVFSDSIYKILDIVNPKTVIDFEVKSLIGLKAFKKFSQVVESPNCKGMEEWRKINPAQADEEWRSLALIDFNDFDKDNVSATEFWRKMFNRRNAAKIPLTPNVNKLIKILLILPFSNAEVERVFSDLSLTKTPNRSNLHTETLKSLMFTASSVKDIVSFVPRKDMLNKYTKMNQEIREEKKQKKEKSP